MDRYPFDEAIYRDEDEGEHRVVVRRAKSREEMRPPVPKPQGTPKRLPWAEVALNQEAARREAERGASACANCPNFGPRGSWNFVKEFLQPSPYGGCARDSTAPILAGL